MKSRRVIKNEKQTGIEKLSSTFTRLGLASIAVVTAAKKTPNTKKLKLQRKARPHITTIGMALRKNAEEPAIDFSKKGGLFFIFPNIDAVVSEIARIKNAEVAIALLVNENTKQDARSVQLIPESLWFEISSLRIIFPKILTKI